MSENTAKKFPETRISRLDVVRAGGGDTGSLKIPKRGRVVVDIMSVVPDPRNERKSFQRISELAATIKAVGIIDPPTVVPLEDGRYMITTGERRWRAAKEAGLKQIPVIIGDAEDEKRRRTKSLISNIQREDLSALELSQALLEMKEENPDVKTNRDLAAAIGKSEQWVGQMLKILELSDEVKEQIRASKRAIPYDAVIEIARVGEVKAQADLLENVLAGATVRQVREKARATKPTSKRAGKKQSTQKIATSKGWVIIHCEKKTAGKSDYLEALAEATKVIKAGKDL